MKKTSISLLLILLCLTNCEDVNLSIPYEEFLIPKGEHSSRHITAFLANDYLSYDVIFDYSAKYTTKNPNNQADVNKLFGFADCNSLHTENSVRFGWRYYEEELQILGLIHLEGDIIITNVLATVEFNQSYRYDLLLYDDRYEFNIVGKTEQVIIFPRSKNLCTKGTYYLLWPYFGGDERAPQNITIHMRQRYDKPAIK